jgi:hypothetical protein
MSPGPTRAWTHHRFHPLQAPQASRPQIGCQSPSAALYLPRFKLEPQTLPLGKALQGPSCTPGAGRACSWGIFSSRFPARPFDDAAGGRDASCYDRMTFIRGDARLYLLALAFASTLGIQATRAQVMVSVGLKK